MNSTVLMINHQRILLRDDVDIGVLIDSVEAAVARGGAFVRIPGINGDEYDVLITTSTHFIVRYVPHTFEATGSGADEQWSTSIDLDLLDP